MNETRNLIPSVPPYRREFLVTTISPAFAPDEKVWRYMSFARFAWLLQKKRLWLSRADLLGDPWEISLAGNQLEHVVSRHPITPLSSGAIPESAMKRSERIIRTWRQQTFVNCWSASSHESHALWRIYCRSAEGVAIQTTFARLKASIGDLPLHRVLYETPGSARRTPTLADLVTKKRPVFAYEQEVRIVRSNDDATSGQDVPGYGLEWNSEEHVEAIFVHPEADSSFFETVAATTLHYAPALQNHVSWSAMKLPPPF